MGAGSTNEQEVTTRSNVGESIMKSGILRQASMSLLPAPSPGKPMWRTDARPVCSRRVGQRDGRPNPKGRAS